MRNVLKSVLFTIKLMMILLMQLYAIICCIVNFLGRFFRLFSKLDKIFFYIYTCILGLIVFGINNKKIKWMNDFQLPVKRPIVIIANHRSWLDTILIMYYAGISYGDYRFMVSHYLKYYPGFGWYMWLKKFPFVYSGSYIKKGKIQDKKRMIKDNRQAVIRAYQNACNEDPVWCVFPEGTRSIDENKLIGKPKAAAMMHYVDVMQEGVQCIDFTIEFPKTMSTAASFLSIKDPMKVWRKSFIIPKGIRKSEMQKILDDLWLEKEKLLQSEK